MTRLTVRFFGPPEVTLSDGTPLPPTRTRKGLWLFALLVLRAGKTVEREWLAGQLWPDVLPTAALANLRRALTDLRHVLGPDAALLSSPTANTLCLDMTNCECDVLRFDAAPQQALALYRGVLLEGCNEEWVFPERRAREEVYLQAHLALAEKAPLDEARQHFYAVLEADPHQEGTVRRLMEVCVQLGQHSEALQVYRRFREFLYAQRLQPDPQTTALFERLRSSLNVPVPASPTSHLALPVPLTPFVGRAQEQERLVHQLHEGTRLVTLLGPGGVGKTRLMLTLAMGLPASLTVRGYVDCSPLREASELPQALTRALDLRVPEGSRHEQVLWAALQEEVLFLDNLEQVQGEVGPFLMELLSRCGCLQLVVASRVRLDLPGEFVLRLGGLPSDEATGLFLQRAAAAGATLTESDREAVVTLCEQLDGLPLALELAAPWCEHLAPKELLALLDNRFALLQGKGPQKGLEATLSWSWERLSVEQKRQLSALTVLAGAWTLGAGAAALGRRGEELATLEILSALANTSWLVIEPGPPRRYRLLESIRAFVCRQMPPEPRLEALGYLLEWWEQRVETQTRDTAHWLQLVHTDLESLRSVLEYCTQRPEDALRGLYLVDAASVYFFFRGLARECQERTQSLLQRVPRVGEQYARWLSVLSGCALWQGDFPQAQAYLQEALTFCTEGPGRAYVLGILGVTLRKQGALEQAQRCHLEALAFHERQTRPNPIAVEKMRLGVVKREQGDNEAAQQYFREASAEGDTLVKAGTLAEWARLERRRGAEALALTFFEEAIALQRTLGNQPEVELLLRESAGSTD